MEVTTIAQKLFYNTVKISTVGPNGSGSGTGFFFQLIRADGVVPFIVTNKHVIENTTSGTLTFTLQKEGKPILGQGLDYHVIPTDWQSMWQGHPSPDVDIAVCPLNPIVVAVERETGFSPFTASVADNQIPTKSQLNELDALEEVLFVGYPNGIWDNKNLLPVMRRGTTATPLQVDFEGAPKFLIDASVFGGSSGSPIYILRNGSFNSKGGDLVIGTQFYFVGVVAAVYFRRELNDVVEVPIPTATRPMADQREMLDLGVAYKSSTVREAAEYFMAARGHD